MWSTTEGNSCTFPLAITTELLDSWGVQASRAEEAIKQLVGELYGDNMGCLSVSTEPPANGYWFDTHNSKPTIRETMNAFINVQDHLPFLSNPADKDRISGIFGGAILCELEQADALVFQQKGQRLLGDLDTSFDRSRVVHDLRTPPTDDKDLGHKINLLAAIIDKIKIKMPGLKSIRALESWLATIVGDQQAQQVVEPFDGVSCLRNQYPVHDQFEKRKTPKHVEEAEAYFGFRDIDDAARKWQRVCDAFNGAVQGIVKAVS